MILVQRHGRTNYLELYAPYQHKDAIKALADYPDRKWEPEGRCWLLHAGCIDTLIAALGAHLAPLDPALIMWLPVEGDPKRIKPKRRRRQGYQARREEQEAAQRVGRLILEIKR